MYFQKDTDTIAYCEDLDQSMSSFVCLFDLLLYHQSKKLRSCRDDHLS